MTFQDQNYDRVTFFDDAEYLAIARRWDANPVPTNRRVSTVTFPPLHSGNMGLTPAERKARDDERYAKSQARWEARWEAEMEARLKFEREFIGPRLDFDWARTTKNSEGDWIR